MAARTNFFSLLFFSLIFAPPFFRPFRAFGQFSAPVWHPFGVLFSSFFPRFFPLQIYTSFCSLFHPCPHLQNLQNYYKTSSFQPSTPFSRIHLIASIFAPLSPSFSHAFRIHFAYFFTIDFSTPFFSIFSDFSSKMGPKRDGRGDSRPPPLTAPGGTPVPTWSF